MAPRKNVISVNKVANPPRIIAKTMPLKNPDHVLFGESFGESFGPLK